MSYCVNCGVKLGPSEEKCPLCDTIVQNPVEPFDPRAPKPFAQRSQEQTLQMNRRYIFGLITTALLIPAGICALIDLLVGGGITWSLYPLGALFLLWVALCTPVIVQKHRTYITITMAALSLCGYLWLVEHFASQSGWFFPVALPSVILATLCILGVVASIRQRLLRGLAIPGTILMLIALLTFLIELLTSSYTFGQLRIQWSPFVMIPCCFIGIILYIIQGHAPLREELKKRLHI